MSARHNRITPIQLTRVVVDTRDASLDYYIPTDFASQSGLPKIQPYSFGYCLFDPNRTTLKHKVTLPQ